LALEVDRIAFWGTPYLTAPPANFTSNLCFKNILERHCNSSVNMLLNSGLSIFILKGCPLFSFFRNVTLKKKIDI